MNTYLHLMIRGISRQPFAKSLLGAVIVSLSLAAGAGFAFTPGGPGEGRCRSECMKVHKARMAAIMDDYGHTDEYREKVLEAVQELHECEQNCTQGSTINSDIHHPVVRPENR